MGPTLYPDPPAVLTVTVSGPDRSACGGCRVDRSGPGAWLMEQPPRYCPVPRHKPRCPECGSAELVLSHALGDPHVNAECARAHTWPVLDLDPAEFRFHSEPITWRHRASLPRVL